MVVWFMLNFADPKLFNCAICSISRQVTSHDKITCLIGHKPNAFAVIQHIGIMKNSYQNYLRFNTKRVGGG